MKATQSEFTSQLLDAQQSLKKFALKLTSNQTEASDLVQDTTLKALYAEDSFAEKSNFSGWIMTIMRNTFFNNCRSSKRTLAIIDQTVDADGFAMAEITSQAPTPDSVYNANQISQVIAGLPDILRLPFSMFMEGYKYAEIAKKLDLPLGLVKSRILNARKALRTKLADN